MDELPKTYRLPALPPAPPSDLQALVRRWFECADFSAVGPILDELQALGRHRDHADLLRWLAGAVGRHAADPTARLDWHAGPPEELWRLFCFDLFDFASSVRWLAGRLKPPPR